MKVKDESSEMISEILEVNPNKKSKKVDKKESTKDAYEWTTDEDAEDEKL